MREIFYKSSFLWFVSIMVVVFSVVYQRVTGPTYPVRGKITVNNETIPFKLLRSENVGTPLSIVLETKNPELSGEVVYKRYKSFDPWTTQAMSRQGNRLIANLPPQPPAGKLIYKVFLIQDGKRISLTGEDTVIARYKGRVPNWVLIPHVIAMFLAMLLAVRAGLETIKQNPNLKPWIFWTISMLFIGGFILGPLTQKFAFGEFWTGIPFGHDLTDNKALIAMLAWLWAWYRNRGEVVNKRTVVLAAVVMMVVYLIPHSVLGSEIDYTQMPK